LGKKLSDEEVTSDYFLELLRDESININDMKISILTEKNGWFDYKAGLLADSIRSLGHSVSTIHYQHHITEGDILFVLGFYKLVSKEFMTKNKNNIVVHESALPQGKGWSPLSWQILEGKNSIPFTLFEMDEKTDNGDIYIQDILHLNGTELCEEIREKQANKKIEMCIDFIKQYPTVLLHKRKQSAEGETFYKKRDKESCRLDINKTIIEQFNLLRIADNKNYPAFFEINGIKYELGIYKEVSKTRDIGEAF